MPVSYCEGGTTGEFLSELIGQAIPYLFDFPAQDTSYALHQIVLACRAAAGHVAESVLMKRLTTSLNLMIGLDWRDEARRVTLIGEVNPDATLTPIWAWQEQGLRPTGLRPRCVDRIIAAGLHLPAFIP